MCSVSTGIAFSHLSPSKEDEEDEVVLLVEVVEDEVEVLVDVLVEVDVVLVDEEEVEVSLVSPSPEGCVSSSPPH